MEDPGVDDSLTYEQKVEAIRAIVVASGICVIGVGYCVTHECKADFGHYLETRPAHSALGIAVND